MVIIQEILLLKDLSEVFIYLDDYIYMTCATVCIVLEITTERCNVYLIHDHPVQ